MICAAYAHAWASQPEWGAGWPREFSNRREACLPQETASARYKKKYPMRPVSSIGDFWRQWLTQEGSNIAHSLVDRPDRCARALGLLLRDFSLRHGGVATTPHGMISGSLVCPLQEEFGHIRGGMGEVVGVQVLPKQSNEPRILAGETATYLVDARDIQAQRPEARCARRVIAPERLCPFEAFPDLVERQPSEMVGPRVRRDPVWLRAVLPNPRLSVHRRHFHPEPIQHGLRWTW